MTTLSIIPQPPRMIWSPDSTRFVVYGGDRPAPSLFSIATMSDLQMRRIDVGTISDEDKARESEARS